MPLLSSKSISNLFSRSGRATNVTTNKIINLANVWIFLARLQATFNMLRDAPPFNVIKPHSLLLLRDLLPLTKDTLVYSIGTLPFGLQAQSGPFTSNNFVIDKTVQEVINIYDCITPFEILWILGLTNAVIVLDNAISFFKPEIRASLYNAIEKRYTGKDHVYEILEDYTVEDESPSAAASDPTNDDNSNTYEHLDEPSDADFSDVLPMPFAKEIHPALAQFHKAQEAAKKREVENEKQTHERHGWNQPPELAGRECQLCTVVEKMFEFRQVYIDALERLESTTLTGRINRLNIDNIKRIAETAGFFNVELGPNFGRARDRWMNQDRQCE